MRTMVNKDVISPFTEMLQHTSPELAALVLRFIPSIANAPVDRQDVTYEPVTGTTATKVLVCRLEDRQSRHGR
jgi:hypothetical protein